MRNKCIYYIPANYGVCSTRRIGGYCHGICENFESNDSPEISIDKSNPEYTNFTKQHGYDDYNIKGYGAIRRAKVRFNIEIGDIFNIYLGESTKHGCEWLGTLEKSLTEHLKKLELEATNEEGGNKNE